MALRTLVPFSATILLSTMVPVVAATAAPVPAAAIAAPTRISAEDITTSRSARTSRATRAGISVRAWANSATARRVARAESGGNCRAVSPSGKYRGKWQMDADFWRSYGGRAYASTPDRASCAQQDIVAHRGWVARWWQPWSTF